MLDTSEFIIKALIEFGSIDEAAANRLREYAVEHELGFDEAVIRSNIVASREVAIVKAMICEYPFTELKKYDIDIRLSRCLPKSMSERLRAFPLFIFGDIATVAMEDPLDLQAIDELRQTLKKQIDPVVCDAQQLRMLITRA